jgi:hypothetical protein
MRPAWPEVAVKTMHVGGAALLMSAEALWWGIRRCTGI